MKSKYEGKTVPILSWFNYFPPFKQPSVQRSSPLLMSSNSLGEKRTKTDQESYREPSSEYQPVGNKFNFILLFTVNLERWPGHFITLFSFSAGISLLTSSLSSSSRPLGSPRPTHSSEGVQNNPTIVGLNPNHPLSSGLRKSPSFSSNKNSGISLSVSSLHSRPDSHSSETNHSSLGTMSIRDNNSNKPRLLSNTPIPGPSPLLRRPETPNYRRFL
jgi:hypothetical protein